MRAHSHCIRSCLRPSSCTSTVTCVYRLCECTARVRRHCTANRTAGVRRVGRGRVRLPGHRHHTDDGPRVTAGAGRLGCVGGYVCVWPVHLPALCHPPFFLLHPPHITRFTGTLFPFSQFPFSQFYVALLAAASVCLASTSCWVRVCVWGGCLCVARSTARLVSFFWSSRFWQFSHQWVPAPALCCRLRLSWLPLVLIFHVYQLLIDHLY